jgi:hypothetical protein
MLPPLTPDTSHPIPAARGRRRSAAICQVCARYIPAIVLLPLLLCLRGRHWRLYYILSFASNFYNFAIFFIFISDSEQLEDALSNDLKLDSNGFHFPFIFLSFWAKIVFSHLYRWDGIFITSACCRRENFLYFP